MMRSRDDPSLSEVRPPFFFFEFSLSFHFFPLIDVAAFML